MVHWRSKHKHIRSRVLRYTREREIDLIIESLVPYLNQESSRPKVLEFGAGNCYQAHRLTKIGCVTASDTNFGEAREQRQDVNLVISNLEQAPFKSSSFDVILSNHVLEHLADLTKALAEASRIGKPDALFAFTVPTRLWLLLAQPAAIGWNLSELSRSWSWRRDGVRGFGKIFQLTGHSEYLSFSEAYDAFRPSSWIKLLEANGFRVLKRVRLLWVCPVRTAFASQPKSRSMGMCSSMLFVLKERTNDMSRQSDLSRELVSQDDRFFGRSPGCECSSRSLLRWPLNPRPI